MNVDELIEFAKNKIDRQLDDYPFTPNIELAQAVALIAIAESLNTLVKFFSVAGEIYQSERDEEDDDE